MDGRSCEDLFHQMLAWEWDDPANLVVHHLTVLSYHLQHPSLYSPEGLAGAKGLLVGFVERGVSPEEARRALSAKVDSGKRGYKIRGTPESHGSYDPPIRWTKTATDVISGGIEGYIDNVRTWARSILDALRTGDRSL